MGRGQGGGEAADTGGNSTGQRPTNGRTSRYRFREHRSASGHEQKSIAGTTAWAARIAAGLSDLCWSSCTCAHRKSTVANASLANLCGWYEGISRRQPLFTTAQTANPTAYFVPLCLPLSIANSLPPPCSSARSPQRRHLYRKTNRAPCPAELELREHLIRVGTRTLLTFAPYRPRGIPESTSHEL